MLQTHFLYTSGLFAVHLCSKPLACLYTKLLLTDLFNLLESGFKITDIEWETFNNNEDWSEVSDETVRILTICCSHDGKSFDAPREIINNYYSMTNATASTTENSINYERGCTK